MKVAVISPDDLSTVLFTKTMSQILHEAGDVELTTVGEVVSHDAELAAVRSKHVNVPMARYIGPAQDARYLLALFGLMKRHRFDSVLSFTTKPNIYTAFAARASGISDVTLAIRGLGRVFEPTTNPKARLMQEALILLYRRACGIARQVWFTNPKDKMFFLDRKVVPEAKTFLTTNAVNLSDFSAKRISPAALDALRRDLGLNPMDRVVVMVARLVWAKGIREFCEAAELLRERLPQVSFLLVAPPEGSTGAVPESYVREMEGRARLKWLGFRKDVAELYALSDLAVLPSYYKEGGYPRALLEPMALGKAVIAADTDDCRGPVEAGRNGLLVPPRSARDLADAMERLMLNDDLRRAFGAHSLERVAERFDDRAVMKDVLSRIGWIRA